MDGIDTLPQLIAQKLQKHKRVLMEPAQRPSMWRISPSAVRASSVPGCPSCMAVDNFAHLLHRALCPRGREKSRKPGDIPAEFKSLVEAGYKEITLLGQNVTSYGAARGQVISLTCSTCSALSRATTTSVS